MSRFQGQRVGQRRRDGRRRPRRHASYLFLELELLVDAGARRRAGSDFRRGRLLALARPSGSLRRVSKALARLLYPHWHGFWPCEIATCALRTASFGFRAPGDGVAPRNGCCGTAGLARAYAQRGKPRPQKTSSAPLLLGRTHAHFYFAEPAVLGSGASLPAHVSTAPTQRNLAASRAPPLNRPAR